MRERKREKWRAVEGRESGRENGITEKGTREGTRERRKKIWSGRGLEVEKKREGAFVR